MNIKNTLIVGAISLGIIGTGIMSVSAFTSEQTKADILSKLTNKASTEIIDQRNNEDKTYGELAKEYGVLEDFKTQNLEAKKEILKQKIADGTITQERADEITKIIEERSANCDGTNQSKKGSGFGRELQLNGSKKGTGNNQRRNVNNN